MKNKESKTPWPPMRQMPCVHHDARPPGAEVCLLVVHCIALPPGTFGGDAVADFFGGTLDIGAHPYYETLRGLRVSAHFFIHRNGAVLQFVDVRRRAWHAGESVWRGCCNCNDFSLGVELEGDEALPYCDVQYDSLAALVRAAAAHYPNIQVAGHEHIAPGRKNDPGPLFDWQRLFALVGKEYDGRDVGI